MAQRPKSFWRWELVAMVGSVLFLLVMVVLLLVYNGKPIWDRRGLTLNAVISILATGSKASLMFAIGEAVGQWKWLLFAREPRPLIDFESVDAASRGPLGSSRALWPTKNYSYLRLGALITVLGLTLDPFSQQLVQYRQQSVYVSDVHTTISRAQRYSKGTETISFPWGAVAEVDFSMESAVLYGLAHPYDTVTQQASFACSSGNCTWDAFDSLSVCSTCNDLTSDLTSYTAPDWLYVNLASIFGPPPYSLDDNGTTIQLPNGLFLNNENGTPYIDDEWLNATVFMTTYGSGSPSKTVSLEKNDSLIWAVTVLKMSRKPRDAWPRAPVEALECAVYYCVNSYESSVQNGILQEIETPSIALRDPQSLQPTPNGSFYGNATTNDASIEFVGDLSWSHRYDLMFDGQFNVSQAAVDGISNYFQRNFKVEDLASNITQRKSDLVDHDLVTINGYLIDAGYTPRVMKVFYDAPSLNDTFKALARSMTNAIRADADNSTVQTGSTQVTTTIYNVVRPWITLQVILIVATILFLLVTMRRTSRASVPAWKSHSLAILSRYTDIGDVITGAEPIGTMEEKASHHPVQFFVKGAYQKLGSGTIAPAIAVNPVTPSTNITAAAPPTTSASAMSIVPAATTAAAPQTTILGPTANAQSSSIARRTTR